jgi:hypothetical protein
MGPRLGEECVVLVVDTEGWRVGSRSRSLSRVCRTTSASRRNSVSTGAFSSASANRTLAKPLVLGCIKLATPEKNNSSSFASLDLCFDSYCDLIQSPTVVLQHTHVVILAVILSKSSLGVALPLKVAHLQGSNFGTPSAHIQFRRLRNGSCKCPDVAPTLQLHTYM